MGEDRKFCTYCGKWFDGETMTPLFEEGKSHINYYCERCVTHVKGNLVKLPFYHLYRFGDKGE